MPTYILRDLPPAIWDRARAKADAEGWPLRPLILQLLDDYGAGRIAPTVGPPPPRKPAGNQGENR